MTTQELVEKVKLLPYSPGVYMMQDKNGKIIYVGKSKSLRNRVSSYFQDPSKLTPKTARLSQNICDFSCIYTDTETEALILENELIKRHSPKYNIKLKDSKNYPYIKITSDDFPKITLSRTRNADKSKYFGPYISSKSVWDIIDTVNRIFKTASCGKKFEYGKSVSRPCINYHMGKCVAPCTGKVSPTEYNQLFTDVSSFLKGDYIGVMDNFKAKMLKASDELKFEVAAQYRDRITALEKLEENQKILSDPNSDRDIFGIYEGETISVISILFVRAGKLIDKELVYVSESELTDSASLCDFVMRYYSSREYVPKSVYVSFSLEQNEYDSLSAFLSEKSSRSVEVKTPKKSMGKKLTDLACENAEQAVTQYFANKDKNSKILERLARHLALDSFPERIEAYDISNHGSQSMYAGMIVIENGSFKKSDYRSFSIKTVSGTDDYAAMYEALDRRLSKIRAHLDGATDVNDSFSAMPDLILLDGGKGHVDAVKPLLDKYNLPIGLFGMVKDSFHKTRTLTDGENEISISNVQDIFTFIYKIQEEVHRFTFSKMDSSRRKNVKKSVLESVDGVGPAKAKAILKHFKTIKSVIEASAKQLTEVSGISEQVAENIYNYFHGNNQS